MELDTNRGRGRRNMFMENHPCSQKSSPKEGRGYGNVGQQLRTDATKPARSKSSAEI